MAAEYLGQPALPRLPFVNQAAVLLVEEYEQEQIRPADVDKLVEGIQALRNDGLILLNEVEQTASSDAFRALPIALRAAVTEERIQTHSASAQQIIGDLFSIELHEDRSLVPTPTTSHQTWMLNQAMSDLKFRITRMSPSQRALVAHRMGTVSRSNSTPAKQRLVAYLTMHNDKTSASELRKQLGRTLPNYMLPSHYVLLEQLPRLANGKIDRSTLKRSSALPAFQTESARTDMDSAQSRLATLWARLLGQPEISAEDNFFEWGGHSLLVLHLVEEIDAKFGYRLTAADIFANPTPRSLAEYMTAKRTQNDTRYNHIITVQTEGDGIPIFCIHSDFLLAIITDALRGERPIYEMRGIGFGPDGNWWRWKSITELAEEMVKEICRCYPGGPYIISGYSIGAVIAIEIVRILEIHRLPVRKLILFDPTPWNIYRIGPVRLQFRKCTEPLFGMKPSRALYLWALDNNPFTDRPYRRLGLILIRQPRRRLVRLLARFNEAVGKPLTDAMINNNLTLDRIRLLLGFHPQPVNANTVFFTSSEPNFDSAVLWRPCFHGRIRVHQLRDRHLTLGKSATVQREIFNHLREELEG